MLWSGGENHAQRQSRFERSVVADRSGLGPAVSVCRGRTSGLARVVTTIVKLRDVYEDFAIQLYRIHPRYDQTLQLPFYNEEAAN